MPTTPAVLVIRLVSCAALSASTFQQMDFRDPSLSSFMSLGSKSCRSEVLGLHSFFGSKVLMDASNLKTNSAYPPLLPLDSFGCGALFDESTFCRHQCEIGMTEQHG